MYRQEKNDERRQHSHVKGEEPRQCIRGHIFASAHKNKNGMPYNRDGAEHIRTDSGGPVGQLVICQRISGKRKRQR